MNAVSAIAPLEGRVRPTAKRRKPSPSSRTRDPEATRADILAVAAIEFATHGYSGARVDRIAARMKNSKQMLYYYYRNKSELYRCVLRECYQAIRIKERALDLQGLSPRQALEAIVTFNFNHHIKSEHFIRIVMSENVLMGRNIVHVPHIQAENASVIELLRTVCDRGAADGSMRADIDPIDLHMTISALCFFNVANRHTFSFVFDRDMASEAASAARLRSVIDTVLASVLRL